jgi:hypothetical protein
MLIDLVPLAKLIRHHFCTVSLVVLKQSTMQ